MLKKNKSIRDLKKSSTKGFLNYGCSFKWTIREERCEVSFYLIFCIILRIILIMYLELQSLCRSLFCVIFVSHQSRKEVYKHTVELIQCRERDTLTFSSTFHFVSVSNSQSPSQEYKKEAREREEIKNVSFKAIHSMCWFALYFAFFVYQHTIVAQCKEKTWNDGSYNLNCLSLSLTLEMRDRTFH